MNNPFDHRPEHHARARKDDLQTSHDAAKAVNADAQREIVRSFALNHADGFIHEELVEQYKGTIKGQGLRSRCKELVRDNWIINTGQTRPNRNNRQCVVWKHRNYVENPPPLIEGKPDETKAQLRDEIKRLQGILDAHGIGY